MVEQFGAEWLEEDSSSDAETPEPEVEEPEARVADEPETEAVDAVEPVERPPVQVPVSALQEERRKRQELERRLEALEKPKGETVQRQPEKIPDAYEDPDGYNRYQEGKFAQTEWNMRASMSERFAIKEHGKELVDAATAWALENAQRDPGMAQVIMADPDPVGLTIQKYQQSRTLESLAGKSLEEAHRDYAIAQGWIVSPEATTPSSLKPSSPKPPRGLSQAPGSGATVPAITGFDEVFSDKSMGLRK